MIYNPATAKATNLRCVRVILGPISAATVDLFIGSESTVVLSTCVSAAREARAILHVALRRVETGADPADDLAVDYDRKIASGPPSEAPHRSVLAGFQKRNRNPTVGAMLLRWRKPKANPPFTCV